MDPYFRGHSRQAAKRAEYFVKAIAQQEEQTRNELQDIARFQERSAHIQEEPSKVVKLKLNSDQGHQLLNQFLLEEPDAPFPVIQPFETLTFKSNTAKQTFGDLVSRPIVIDNDEDNKGRMVDNRRLKVAKRAGNAANKSVQRERNLPVGYEYANQPYQTPPITPAVCPPAFHPRPANNSSFVHNGPTYSSPMQAVQPYFQTQQHHLAPNTVQLPTACKGFQPNINSGHIPRAYAETNRAFAPRPNGALNTISPVTSQGTLAHSIAHSVGTPKIGATASCDSSLLNLEIETPTALTFAAGDELAGAVQLRDDGRFFLEDIRYLPPRDLPEHVSYRVGSRPEERLMKFQAPPNGWEGCTPSPLNTDHSDPRFWSAPRIREQNVLWHALGPTLKEYSEVTQEQFTRSEAVLLPFGYDATYNQIHNKFTQWCFTTLGFNHEWTKYGKVTQKLFKLERWYGLIEDYEYAPNWPYRRRGFDGRILQNPDCFACWQCIQLDVFCHGHREDRDARCKPCLSNGYDCSKTLM